MGLEKKKVTKKEKTALIYATEKAVQELIENGQRVDFQSVARKLGVARSTLYRNQTVYSIIAHARYNQYYAGDPIAHLQWEIEGLKERVTELEERIGQVVENDEMIPPPKKLKEEQKSEK